MGQKVNPHGLRVGVIKDWDSRWFANKATFGDTLVEDYNVRNYIKKSLYAAGVARIEIERFADKVRIHVNCAKPGIVIGKGGENIESNPLERVGERCSVRPISSRKDMSALMMSAGV